MTVIHKTAELTTLDELFNAVDWIKSVALANGQQPRLVLMDGLRLELTEDADGVWNLRYRSVG